MNRYAFEVRLTTRARELLRPGEALVLDWHRISVCCAGAGELGLYAMKEKGARKRKGLVRLKGEDPIYAARAVFPHLAGREVNLDARKILGLHAGRLAGGRFQLRGRGAGKSQEVTHLA